MAIRTILLEDDETLRKKSRAVERFDARLHQLLDDMAETMRSANGVGLAAPQVGVLRRAVIIDDGNGLKELINPAITCREGSQEEVEGCLSCPGLAGVVQRPARVIATAFDRHGNPITVEGEELLARAICHELDHLDGVLFKDIAIEMVDDEEYQMD